MRDRIDEALRRSSSVAREAARKFIHELPPTQRAALMPGVGILLDGDFVPMRLADLASCIEAVHGPLADERDRYKAALEKIAEDFRTHNRYCGENGATCPACVARAALEAVARG